MSLLRFFKVFQYYIFLCDFEFSDCCQPLGWLVVCKTIVLLVFTKIVHSNQQSDNFSSEAKGIKLDP